MDELGTVSVELLRLALRFARGREIDATPALRAFRLDERRDGDRVDGGRFAGFLAALAEDGGDPLLAARFGAWAAAAPVHHLVLATAFSSETAGEALERLLRYHALLADALTPTIVRAGAAVELRVAAGRDGLERGPLVEAAVAMLAGLVRRIGGGEADVEVRLRRAPPPGPAGERAAFGGDVRFGAPADAVRFPARVLGMRLPGADAELAELLSRHAAGRLATLRSSGWAARTAAAVRDGLVRTGRIPTLGEACRALAVAPRTLQLRLKEERTGYRTVTEEVRRSRGEELLGDRTVSLVEVAFLLGFGDQSAFTNAFRRWTGRSPAAYRRSISPVRR